MTDFLRLCAVSCSLCAMLVFNLPASAQASLFGGGEEKKALEAALGDVDSLLQMLKNPQLPFHHSRTRNLLSFVALEKDKPGSIKLPGIEGAEGAYWEFSIPVPLSKIVRYMYNPDVPPHAVYPGSVRMGGWNDEEAALAGLAPLLAGLPEAEEAVSFRGSEFEITTPDPNTGSYFHYDLNRLVAGFRNGNGPVLVSVSRMARQSDVSLKGLAFGPKDDWFYFYSDQPGNLMTGVSWAESYMYDSISVFVFSELTPGKTKASLFKWVNAGWKGMNMAKHKHILEGCKDFARNIQAVLGAASLPSPEEIIAKARLVEAMDEATLRAELQPLAEYLVKASAETKDLARKEFEPLIKGGGYLASLNKDELAAELLKDYMRRALGRPAITAGPRP